MKSALRERLRTLASEGEDPLKELTDYAIERDEVLAAARDEMFAAKLKKYAAMAAGDFKDRLSGQQGNPLTRTIFDHALSTNFSLQLPRNVGGFLLARVDKDAFGSRPWLAVSPRGTRNQALSAEIQKHGEFKLMEASWRDRARGALKDTFDFGWVPVKTTWREDWNVSETLKSILFDGERGQPAVTQSGDYLFPEDDTEEVPPADGEPLQDGMPEAGGEMGPAPRVFTKDPSIPAPHPSNNHSFKSHLVEEKDRLYCGLDFTQLAHKDVSWPINAAELNLDCPACDFIGVTTSLTIEQIRTSYNPNGDDEDVESALDELKSGDGSPKSAASMPNEAQGEPEVKGTDIKNPAIKVLEGYFRRRVLPTGPESRIFMAIAKESRRVIYLEYLPALSPRGQAPIHMLAINQVPGRAYGRGWYEMFEMAADNLDRLLNGIMVRNEYHANAAKFMDSKAAEQLPSGKPVSHGPEKWNTLENKQGGPLANLFYTHEMRDMDAATWQLVELIMQLIQTESGVTNAAQGEMSSLPAAGTATGTNSLLESSSVTHTFLLETVRSGLTPPLRYALELLYFRQDCDDEYDVLDDSSAIQTMEQAGAVVAGGDAGARPGVMTYAQAQKLANVPLNVEILLSRAKRQELREAAFAAIPQVQGFYGLPAPIQLKLLPLYVQAMRGLDIDNPDKLFPSPAELQAQMEAMKNQPPDDGAERISLREQMSYADTPPSIQAQMERDAGFEPASEEERAAHRASKDKGKPPEKETPRETTSVEPEPQLVA
jgi:hypothetical protein